MAYHTQFLSNFVLIRPEYLFSIDFLIEIDIENLSQFVFL